MQILQHKNAVFILKFALFETLLDTIIFPICYFVKILEVLLIQGVAQFFPSAVVILKMFNQSDVHLVVLSNRYCKVCFHLEHKISHFKAHLFYISNRKDIDLWCHNCVTPLPPLRASSGKGNIRSIRAVLRYK